MRSVAAGLMFCALLAATPAFADEKDDAISALLKEHLTKHGRDILRHEKGLVAIGDVSPSGLKDDLRQNCAQPRDCLRLHGLSDDEVRREMSRLIMQEAEDRVRAKIMGIEHDMQHAENDHMRGKDKDFNAKKDMDAGLELHRLRSIDAEVQDALGKIRNDERHVLELLRAQ